MMDIKQVKKLHACLLKHPDGFIKQSCPILGHTVEVEYSIDMNICSYAFMEVTVETVEIPKESKKFFNELENVTGRDVIELDYLRETEYDVSKKIAKPFKWFFDLKPTNHVKNYLRMLFYAAGELRTWNEIEKIYDQDQMDNKVVTSRFKINSEYTAILTKGQPNIQVGCQSIPIETVRNLIAAYDKL